MGSEYSEALLPRAKKNDNYQGLLETHAVTVATFIAATRVTITYLSGKWHLGKRLTYCPIDEVFWNVLAMMDTVLNNGNKDPSANLCKKVN